IEKCVTLDSTNIERAAKESKEIKDSLIASGQKFYKVRDAGRSYVVLGLLQDIKEIMTKKGQPMAFAKLQDFKGTISLTFFSDCWKELKPILKSGEVYAFRGKADSGKDGGASFVVDKIEDPHELEKRSMTQVHIQLEGNFDTLREIQPMREFLFGAQGNCLVYFHIEVDGSSYVIKANPQMTVGADPETVQNIKDLPLVKDVWCE
ncbi:MAG: DNA polymerase III subunit alpha, partial [Treponema sp.]|nr:DNA polymerase III subunit alpha [Treponema sp.]